MCNGLEGGLGTALHAKDPPPRAPTYLRIYLRSTYPSIPIHPYPSDAVFPGLAWPPSGPGVLH